tara:strand:+ start:3229 stop:3720 length:492 start_codon:yes stop_codon:yes gene_type:complete
MSIFNSFFNIIEEELQLRIDISNTENNNRINENFLYNHQNIEENSYFNELINNINYDFSNVIIYDFSFNLINIDNLNEELEILNNYNGLSKKLIDKLENKIFNKDEALKNNLNIECAISLEEFKENDNIIILPCKHIFLKESIEKWLNKSKICPICRKEIIFN